MACNQPCVQCPWVCCPDLAYHRVGCWPPRPLPVGRLVVGMDAVFWVYHRQQCCTCRWVMLKRALCPHAFHVGLGACLGALCHLGKTACDRLLVDVVLLLLPPRSTADLQAVAASPALCSRCFPIAAHMVCEIIRCLVARMAPAAVAAASSGVAD